MSDLRYMYLTFRAIKKLKVTIISTMAFLHVHYHGKRMLPSNADIKEKTYKQPLHNFGTT